MAEFTPPDDGLEDGAERIARRAVDAAAKAVTRGGISQVAELWEAALRDERSRAAVASDAPDALRVDIVFPLPDRLWTRTLHVAPGTMVAQAVSASGLLADHPALDLSQGGVGVFGELRSPWDVLRDGDRIEVYRPLGFDPAESRRRRTVSRTRRIAAKRGGRRADASR